jgi:hypothetical protein
LSNAAGSTPPFSTNFSRAGLSARRARNPLKDVGRDQFLGVPFGLSRSALKVDVCPTSGGLSSDSAHLLTAGCSVSVAGRAARAGKIAPCAAAFSSAPQPPQHSYGML